MTKSVKRRKWHHSVLKNYELYLLLLPVVAFYVIFHYVPMYGVQLAFKDFRASLGIWGSPWIGLEHFQRFFSGFFIRRLIVNTLSINIYTLALNFVASIVLALMLNEVGVRKIKKTVQTVTYAPYFLSVVVMVGMLNVILAPTGGLVNNVIRLFGREPIHFMAEPGWFIHIYAWSDAWQFTGFNSIIYLAALAGIDPELHEAAQIDGASRLKRIRHINIPGIMPTIVILFILSCGRVMSLGFEKVFLMQNGANMAASDVIATYVYRVGIINFDYGFSAAIGLFNSGINFILLAAANLFGKLVYGYSLF